MLGNIVAVAVGGALGATGRYLIGLGVPALCAMLHIAGEFPLSTFVANFLGCFAIGVLSVLFDEGPWHNASSWRLFAITGILGGFTTFSTFSLETVALVVN